MTDWLVTGLVSDRLMGDRDGWLQGWLVTVLVSDRLVGDRAG